MSILKYFAATLVAMSSIAAAEPPNWFQESLHRLAPDTSIWVADNSEYQNDKEPFETYVMEWRWGLGRHSAQGRLYGLVDGKDAGTFWEFRVFWHPEKQNAIVQQFGGDGTFGTGTIEPDGENRDRLEQVFHSPNGVMMHVGHKTVHHEDSNEGTSFDILPDGTWQKRRMYTWHRKPRDDT